MPADFTARSQSAEPGAPRDDSLTRRIPEILGAHRLEQGMRIGKGERVEWWECLGCDWKSELFDLGAPGIEAIKRNHHAELIARAVEDHYRPRVEGFAQRLRQSAREEDDIFNSTFRYSVAREAQVKRNLLERVAYELESLWSPGAGE